MAMKEFLFEANNIAKSYEPGKFVFRGIGFSVSNGDITALVGPNGSGKSTLLKIIAGTLRQSEGEVSFSIENKPVRYDRFNEHFGFVSPYLNLYDEFTPLEHFKIVSDIRGIKFNLDKANQLLDKFKLYRRRNDEIRKFSSGMKQRVKFITAFLEETEFLLLDEPFTNLDAEGISSIVNFMFEHQSKGGAIIIATNDDREKALCKNLISVVG
jgi:heme exporter protein A